MNIIAFLYSLFAYVWMQVNLGRRRAVIGTAKLEEIINRHGIKGIIT
jgi:hypothetical protein